MLAVVSTALVKTSDEHLGRPGTVFDETQPIDAHIVCFPHEIVPPLGVKELSVLGGVCASIVAQVRKPCPDNSPPLGWDFPYTNRT